MLHALSYNDYTIKTYEFIHCCMKYTHWNVITVLCPVYKHISKFQSKHIGAYSVDMHVLTLPDFSQPISTVSR